MPLELREMVLEYLEDSIQSGKAKASVYASVCKEWYDYFEPYIFRRLTLSIERLNELEAMITGSRQLFVQHIWLRFERSVQPGVTPIKFRHEMDTLRFRATIFQLFQILSEWPERVAGQPGIALELTAFSAADPDYSMKDTIPDELKDVDLTIDSETLNAIYEKTPSNRRTLTDHERRQQSELREFYDPQSHLALPPVRLPTVGLITDLTMRRQMHISFFTNYIKLIMDSLPNLEFLTYEPRALQPFSRDNFEAAREIITKIPSSIRRLQMFEDSPSLYVDGTYLIRVNDNGGSLGRLLADISQDKEPEVISMSFIIDAVDFFSDFRTPQISRPHWKLGWLNLTSIVLTSAVITPERKDEIPSLLIAAARAARHMPKLEIMELYYVSRNHGGIFTYVHDSTGSILWWDSTWEWKFSPNVISVWKRAANVHGAKLFEHEESLIQLKGDDGMGWDGTILSLLRTRTTVVHPITYGNMMNGQNFM
ncbi:hypothetical protein TrVFT333_006058 [Trichoderma virens FT-333]|nr:hypothetical protein TrVFT333_006058 [Trichoderma virens FT-333]